MALAAMLFACALAPPVLASSVAQEPSFSPSTLERTSAALKTYEAIAAQGGWGKLPASLTRLKPGEKADTVALLTRRLAISGDLHPSYADYTHFDAEVSAGLTRFQARHGLSTTGTVGNLTLRAMNVPVEARLVQLRASIERLRRSDFAFTNRYLVVNIPAASVEAVENGQVARRHLAVVGRKDRASPVLEARVTSINLNPTWTAPLSIVKADIAPKVCANPAFLAENGMRVLYGGAEVDPATINWCAPGAFSVTIRQDSGAKNALGQLRIDMPNAHAVYLHDTPKKELFRSDVRFHSSGCARVAGIRDLAAWLLEGSEWNREGLDKAIATGERKDIRLGKSVPIAWVYLTAWGDGTGQAQFREDVYGSDTPDGIAGTALVAMSKPLRSGVVATGKPAVRSKPGATLAESGFSIDMR